MPFFKSPVDGAQIHYVDYHPAASPAPFHPNSATPKDHSSTKITLVFLHGWPMSHLMYEHLMLTLCEDHRIRCIASDRRGFGKSQWCGSGKSEPNEASKSQRNDVPPADITYTTFANDTISLLTTLNLSRYILIASSMACGESLLAYNTMPTALRASCLGLIWLGPSLPFPLQTPSNPSAPPRELWDTILTGFRADRIGFTRAAIDGVFGIPLSIGIDLPPTVLERYVNMVNAADALAIERCVQIITSRDFTEDLKGIDGKDVKVLVIHGDSDQSMPASCSADLIPKYVSQARVEIYEKAAHGLYLTHAERLVKDIVGFVEGL